MANLIRLIAGLPFIVHSPSLYDYEDPQRKITIQYTNTWSLTLVTPDGIETYHEFSTLAEIIQTLESFIKQSA